MGHFVMAANIFLVKFSVPYLHYISDPKKLQMLDRGNGYCEQKSPMAVHVTQSSGNECRDGKVS